MLLVCFTKIILDCLQINLPEFLSFIITIVIEHGNLEVFPIYGLELVLLDEIKNCSFYRSLVNLILLLMKLEIFLLESSNSN